MSRKRNPAKPLTADRGPRYFSTTVPGLGELLAEEIREHPALSADLKLGNDGRADVVSFRPGRGSLPADLELRLAEDFFVVIGVAQASQSPHQLARSLIDPGGLERALSVWASRVHPLKGAMGFHVVTRVLSEQHFRRTELRAALTAAVERMRPRWRGQDPAELELWVLEQRPGSFLAGLRLSSKAMRQHGEGRAAERHGALRPVVAAAMVRLAGRSPGVLLDPFCGSGTILAEGLAVGWRVLGMDIDKDALQVAAANLPGVALCQADARRLPLDAGSIHALVANLPFGRQFTIEGTRNAWLTKVLREAERVTHPGGRVVLLVPPPIPAKVRPQSLRLERQAPIRLLGAPTTIWAFDRGADRVTWAASKSDGSPHGQVAAAAPAGRRGWATHTRSRSSQSGRPTRHWPSPPESMPSARNFENEAGRSRSPRHLQPRLHGCNCALTVCCLLSCSDGSRLSGSTARFDHAPGWTACASCAISTPMS
jgi:23S rRNA G2445 N2-methylase RlmL